MEYVQLLLAVVLLAVDFAFVKLYQIRQGQGMRASLQYMRGTRAIVRAGAIWHQWIPPERHAIFARHGLLSGALAMAYKLIGFRILAGAQMSLYTFFLLTAV